MSEPQDFAEQRVNESQEELFCRLVGEECVRRGFMLNVPVTGPELFQFVLDGFSALATIPARDERIILLENAVREIKAAHINDGQAFPPADLARYEIRLVNAIAAGTALLSPLSERPEE